MSEVDDLRKAKAAEIAEWNTYRAVSPIFHDGIRAYNEGDPVPVSNVVLHGYDKDGLVEGVAIPSAPAVTEKKV